MSWEEVVDPASSAGFIIRLTPVETDTAESKLLLLQTHSTQTHTHTCAHTILKLMLQINKKNEHESDPCRFSILCPLVQPARSSSAVAESDLH